MKGEPGDPWTAGGTLPSGKTETGTWAITVVTQTPEPFKPKPEDVPTLGSISFPIPLAAPLPADHLVTLDPTATSPNSPGTAEDPKAAAGYLCMCAGDYPIGGQMGLPMVTTPGTSQIGVGRSGAVLYVFGDAGASQSGSWAVTAP